MWSHSRDSCPPAELRHKGVAWAVAAFAQSSLLEFLDILRQCYGDQMNAVWLDAYCIDQESSQDKAAEINRMGQYYAAAAVVVILPNGVDGMRSNSLVFGRDPGHWCKWTQRVWTAPEVSLASEAVVACCLSEAQAQIVRGTRVKDVNKQLFPVTVIHAQTLPGCELLMLPLEGYCELVTWKASGYLDGLRGDNDGDFDYPPGVERLMRTLTGIRENDTITHWIHRIAVRESFDEADRIYSLLPKLGVDIREKGASLEVAIGEILSGVTDSAVMAHLVLSTMTYNRCSTADPSTCVFPSLRLEQDRDSLSTLVYLDGAILPDAGISLRYVMGQGLVVHKAQAVCNVAIQQYAYDGREGFSEDDKIYGNTAYSLGGVALPCAVGRCRDVEVVSLLRFGTVSLSEGDRFRMLELYGDKGTEGVRLVCCMACDSDWHKVGVLLVDPATFGSLYNGDTPAELVIGQPR